MGTINPTLPTVGQPRGGEEADVLNALTALLAEFNGSIDSANLDSAAGILGTQLASAVQQALIPTGTILATAVAAAPTGYLLCDGSAVSRATYAALFSAIGTAYGVGDGSTTFNLPDFRGRSPVGKGTHADCDTLGESDGVAVGSRTPKHAHGHDHTHSHAHNHTFSDTTGTPSSTISVPASGTGSIIVAHQSHTHVASGTTSGVSVLNTSGSSTANTDSANAPYLVCNYMVKI